MEGCLEKKKRNRILFISLLLLAALGIGFAARGQEKGKKEEHVIHDTNTFDGLKEYFLYTEDYDHTEEIKKSWERKEKQTILRDHEQDKNGDGIFVQACFLLEEGKKEKAAEKLQKVLKKSDDRKIKARCYFALSRIDTQRNAYDEAEKDWNKMQDLLRKEDPSFLILLNTQGYTDILEWPDGVKKAVALMEKTRDLAETCGYQKKEEVLSGLAICYYYAGEELKGMEAKVEGLSLAEEHKNTEMIRKISADIGIDYMVAEDYDRAIEYLQKSRSSILKQKEEKDQELLQFHIYVANNLFLSYIGKKDTDQAWEYLAEAKAIIQKEKNGKRKEDDLTYYMSSEAQYYIERKEFDKALAIMKEVERRYEKEDYFFYTNFNIGYREIYGELYNGKGDYKKALIYWKKVEKLYKKQGVDTPDTVCLGGFYEAYNGLGDYKNALKYKNRMYDEISESMKGKEKEHSNFLLEKFESDKREKEINSLQMRNRILWNVVGSVVFFLIITLVFALLIFRKSREIKQLNQKLQELSERDGLTGLYNRRAMDEYLTKNWRNLCEKFKTICVIMLDVDYFKKYNDFYGHQGGDEVLRKVSHVIVGACRKEDMAIRYGGEEFAVILPGATLEQAGKIAENIRSGVRELAILHEKSEVSDRVSISSGVVRAESGCSSEQALKNADDALYEAKKKRDTVYVLETKGK